ncbi:MAG TPA: ABC transporter substrate-binding protein [Chloroflexota bacterium]|nr:ABC transporter substrate-binding protein [Chloroflexota bacterium]
MALGACRAAPAQPVAPAIPAAAPVTTAPTTMVPTTAPSPARVTIGWAPTTAIAPLYVAIERGYFAAQAIEPETIVVQNSSQMVASLGTDEMNVSFGAISAGLLNALGRGIAVKVIAPVGIQPRQGPAANQLLIRKALWDAGEVTGVRDLRGRRVAIAGRGSLIDYILFKLLQRHGMTEQDVDVAEMGFPDMLVALANASVDAALPTEPFVTGAISRGLAVALPDPMDANIVAGQPTTYVMASERFSESEKPVAVRLLTALVHAMRALDDGRAKTPENLAIIAKYTKIEPAVLETNVLTEWDSSLRFDPAFIADQQSFFLASGELDKAVDLDKLIDTRLAAEAVRRA